MKLRSLVTLVMLVAAACPALAADCDVNVWDAYNTAKVRGWTFSCSMPPGVTGGFVTYPPPKSGIGCTFKTPPVVAGPVSAGTGYLFKKAGSAPSLNNGWSVKSFELSGGQWFKQSFPGARVAFAAETVKPSRTYNYVLSKLTLTRSGGSCGNAIDQAF